MPPFIEKLLDRFGYAPKEKAAPASPVIGSMFSFGAITQSGKKISAQKALEANTGWVYACVNAIGAAVSSIEFKLFRAQKDGNKEVLDHDLLNLLYAVNDSQTSVEFIYATVSHLLTTGNAYWYLEGVVNEKSKPRALHLMIASRVKPIVERDQFPMQIQGYEYTVGNKKYSFQPYEVLHFKKPDPADQVEGVGVVQAIASWIDADNYAMEFNRKFFQQGTRIGGVIETDSALTTEQVEYLKKNFEAAHANVNNAYRTLVLPKGVKFDEGGKTQKDLDFANLMNVMRDRILAGFHVPRTVLGITDDVNRANAEATDYVFASRTVKPLMQLITSYLNEFLVPRYGGDLYLDFDDPVPEDEAQEIDEMTKVTAGAPVMTINEAREEYFGLGPLDGGDALMLPFSLQPLSASSPEPQPPQKIIRTRGAIAARKRQELSGNTAKRAAEEVEKQLKHADEERQEIAKNITELSDDQFEALYKGFALRVDKYEKKQTSAVRSFNEKQKKEVIKNLPSIVKAIDKKDLFDYEKSLAAFVDISKPILTELAGKEGEEAAKLLGINDLNILTPEVRKSIDRAVSLLSKSYNDTTRSILKRKLEQGMADGLTLTELADTINEVYDYSDEVRAATVARTETFRIANYATQEAWKQSGVVKSQRWYTAADERVCPWCAPLNGKVVGIEEGFFKKGDVVTGQDGSRLEIEYSDVDAPPLHVSCRCYLRPEEISLQ